MTKVWDFLMSKKVIKGNGTGSRTVIDKQNKVVDVFIIFCLQKVWTSIMVFRSRAYPRPYADYLHSGLYFLLA